MDDTRQSLLFDAKITLPAEKSNADMITTPPNQTAPALDLLKLFSLEGAVQDYHITLPLVEFGKTIADASKLAEEIIFTHKKSSTSYRYSLEQGNYLKFSATETTIQLSETAQLICNSLASTETDVLACSISFSDGSSDGGSNLYKLSTYDVPQSNTLVTDIVNIIISALDPSTINILNAFDPLPVFTLSSLADLSLALEPNEEPNPIPDVNHDPDTPPHTPEPPPAVDPTPPAPPVMHVAIEMAPNISLNNHAEMPLGSAIQITGDANLQYNVNLSITSEGSVIYISRALSGQAINFTSTLTDVNDIIDRASLIHYSGTPENFPLQVSVTATNPLTEQVKTVTAITSVHPTPLDATAIAANDSAALGDLLGAEHDELDLGERSVLFGENVAPLDVSDLLDNGDDAIFPDDNAAAPIPDVHAEKGVPAAVPSNELDTVLPPQQPIFEG